MLGSTATATQMQAKVSMSVNIESIIGNGSFRPDSGEDYYRAAEDFTVMASAADSADEHAIINFTFPDKDGVSTVRLLQLAAQRNRTQTNTWRHPWN